MAITFDNSTSSTASSATSVAGTLTIGSGANRLVVAALMFEGATEPTGISVSGAGGTWTVAPCGASAWNNDSISHAKVQMWKATAPTSGSQTITASWTNAANATLIIATFAGVDQTIPVGNDVRRAPDGAVTFTSITQTLIESVGDWCLDFVSANGAGASPSISGGDATQTSVTTATNNGYHMAMSRAAPATGSCVMGWTTGAQTSHWMQTSLVIVESNRPITPQSLSAATGSIYSGSVTGNSSTVGLGFKPWAVMLTLEIATGFQNTSFGSHVIWGMLCRDTGGALHSFLFGAESDNAQTTTTSTDAARTDACVGFLDAIAHTWKQLASAVSIDNDGFTLNWSTVVAFGNIVYWWAIGGSQITGANILSWTDLTATGNKSVTGAGFKPNFGIFFDAGFTGSFPQTPVTGNNIQYGFGVAADSTHRWCLGGASKGNVSTTVCCKRQLTDHCHILVNSANTTDAVVKADFVSWDTDGFTIHYDTVDASNAYNSVALVLGGNFQASVFTITQPASTGLQQFTGVGFTPSAVGFAADGSTGTAFVRDYQNMYSLVASNASRWTNWVASVDSVSTSVDSLDFEPAQAVSIYQDNSPFSLLGQADFVSADAQGFHLNWGTSDGVARLILGWALGPGAAPAVPAGPIYWSA